MAESTQPTYYGRFRFVVHVDGLSEAGVNQSFVRVSGVESESESMEFMQGTDTYKMTAPGRPFFADVELERVYNGVDAFYGWRREIEAGVLNRRDVYIRMLDISNRPIRLMVCKDAWPKKWVMPELNATSSEPALETITLSVSEVYEGVAETEGEAE